MENFTGLKVNRNEFALTEVTLKKGNNLAAKFIVAKNTNDEIFEAHGALEYRHQSNEAFQNKLYELHPYLCDIKKVTEIDAQRKVHVKGVKLSGSGDSEGFVILGFQNSDKKEQPGVMKCESHKIHFEGAEYRWLSEAKVICNDLEDKVFGYLFNEEKGVPTLFDKVASVGNPKETDGGEINFEEEDDIEDVNHEVIDELEEQTLVEQTEEED